MDACWFATRGRSRCCASCAKGRTSCRLIRGPIRLSMPSIKLSVNVNKVATLRNSRGGNDPNVLEAVATCIAAGAPGITVHPRADARHIRASDVIDIAELLKRSPEIEYNIEGDPRPDLLELVLKVRPTQCTLVPV